MDNGLKRCSHCGVEKKYVEFHGNHRAADKRASWCKKCDHERNVSRMQDPAQRLRILEKCKEYRASNKQQRARSRRRDGLLRRYGITVSQYEAMYEQQQGRCALCGINSPTFGPASSRLHVDHDHSTGADRGLLCGACNVALGNFKDNPEVLETAAWYLRNRFSVISHGRLP